MQGRIALVTGAGSGLGAAIAVDTAVDGIVSCTPSLAQEAGHLGIRVNAVAPGFIDTPLVSCCSGGRVPVTGGSS